jgi:hypothetical protein
MSQEGESELAFQVSGQEQLPEAASETWIGVGSFPPCVEVKANELEEGIVIVQGVLIVSDTPIDSEPPTIGLPEVSVTLSGIDDVY